MRTFFVLSTLALLLAGCAGGPKPSGLLELNENGYVPQTGTLYAAGVGETLYRHSELAGNGGAELTEPVELTLVYIPVRLEKGFVLTGYDRGTAYEYCSAGKPFTIAGREKAPVCFTDDDYDGRFDRASISDYAPVEINGTKPGYRSVFREETGVRGKKVQLVFQGLAGRVLKLTYREYEDDLVRPRLAETLSYNLNRSGPTLIRFREAELEVTPAEGNKIHFKVLKPLEKL